MDSEREQLENRISALLTVQNMAQELMSELNHQRLLHKILHAAVRVLNAADGSVLLWDPSNELVFAVTEDPALLGHRMPEDEGIAGWVFTHCEPLIVGDVSQDSRHFQNIDQQTGFHTQSLIAVPLMTPTEKIGVIEVLNKESGERFNDQDRDILSALAAQAAIALVNARHYQDLEEDRNRILVLEEQMHKKLARDLHDGAAQMLAAMIMDVEFIAMLYEREPQRVPEELDQLRDAATKTLNQVRTAMFELRPVILETQGLKPALESYVEQLTNTEGMSIHLDIRNLEERLPPKVERLCFAIIREAVSNIKKHAYAENTWIVLERRAEDLYVAVRDDGKGFDVAEVNEGYDRRGSLGMINIRERSEALGAKHAIESVPGRGTLVYFIVPLDGTNGLDKVEESQDTLDPLETGNGRRKRNTEPLPWLEEGSPPPTPSSKRRKGTGPLDLLTRNHAEKGEAQ